MGILQKAVETYDSHQSLVGVVQAEHEVLAPVSHIVTSAQLEVVLTEDGEFVSARAVDKKEPKIMIPATEESAGRTSAPTAHPLCDQLGYLAGYDEEKHKLYTQLMDAWCDSPYSHPKVQAVRMYISKNRLLGDLLRSELLSAEQLGLLSKPKRTSAEEKEAKKVDKMLVRWRIQSDDPSVPEGCWMDTSLLRAFSNFYLDSIREKTMDLCMISGEESVPASQHPKGIVSVKGNAKLISANDSSGFTYRGRFTNDSQAAAVSYEVSQKAHNALRWLIAEQGYSVVFGGRTFLCWNPGGDNVPSSSGSFRRRRGGQFTVHNYREELKNTLLSYQEGITNTKGVVICALDAATTGRLAITYYNELEASDYLNRLHQWDAQFCWYYSHFGIESPALPDVVKYAFGTLKKVKGTKSGDKKNHESWNMECDEKVIRMQMQHLIACRVDSARLPKDIVRNLVNRASTPVTYDKTVRSGNDFEENAWKKMLFIACAAVHRIKMENDEGDDAMSWELNTPDRSFQYGRLLAAMNQLEQDYYDRTKENRLTNALKYMAAFRRNPYHVYVEIDLKLTNAYLERVYPYQKKRYEKLKGEIMEILRSFPATELFKALDDTFLLGFDLQRNEFYKSHKKNAEEE